jgi:hypothetical protein
MKDSQHVQTMLRNVLREARTKILEALTLPAPCLAALPPVGLQGISESNEITIGFAGGCRK